MRIDGGLPPAGWMPTARTRRCCASSCNSCRFLRERSPQVQISLHAGELALGLVPPEHMRFHIRDAVMVAGAKRIGHAVDIGYEDHAADTLAEMSKRKVAAEICLTSNDVILGVKDKAHPLPTYLAAKVPVVFASDDEGVSRIDLTNEYLRAAQTYKLDYRTLKQIAHNSLIYSFLPAREKAAAIGRQSQAFDAFERMPAWNLH
jgi:adenosine deaminase